jgi:transposase
VKAKEQQRAVVLQQVEQGALTAGAAADVLGVSLRQVRRLVAAYRQGGGDALRHGNQGRPPTHTISAEVRQRVLALVRTRYHDCNPQHLSELLAEREGLALSRSSLRRILLEAGLYHPRQPAPEPHRQRRARYAQAGMLVQIDASPHDWLQGRGPRLTLLAAIDDATNVIPAALFRLTEDAHGYFLLVHQLVTTHGRPLALYHDRHSIFQHNPKRPWSPAEELAGQPEPTQFGRLLAELGITSIAARSPQAKGRIERLFGTLQTRLVIELRLAGACTLEEANAVLGTFLPKHNDRFQVPASEAGSAYRPWELPCRPEEVFCFKYQRVVAADNTVRFGDQRLQLLPARQRISWARATVEVHERLDGSLAVYQQGTCLATQPAPLEAPALRTRGGPRPAAAGEAPATAATVVPTRPAPPPPQAAGPRKPAPNHPWRHRGLFPQGVTKSLDTEPEG